MANGATFGDTITYEFGIDYFDAHCIIFWGAEPDVATPAQARVVHRALRRGAKLIVVDPRPIPMAKRADVWLRIRPGTDMALALAMQHVIINEGIYNQEFVEKYCYGFDKLKEHVQKYTPEWAAGVTSIPRGRYRESRPPVRHRKARVHLYPVGFGGATDHLHPDLPVDFHAHRNYGQRGCPGEATSCTTGPSAKR